MNVPVSPACLDAEMAEMGRRARAAAKTVRDAAPGVRAAALRAMAEAVRARADDILAANARDMARAAAEAMSAPMQDRLALTPQRVAAMADGVDAIAGQPELLGEVMARWTRPNGLVIERVRVPIGVIGIIYESRPNVTADAGALCVKAGNAVILRGGSDAFASSTAIVAALQAGLRAAGLPGEAVQLVPTPDRAAVGLLLTGLGGAVDMIVPRGGKALVARVQEEARVPVLGHLEGLCHTYVHAAADPQTAVSVVVNAKMRRPAVCGATETLLIDRAAAPRLLPAIVQALQERGCALRGDESACAIAPMAQAQEDDWRTEYSAPILAVRVVEDIAGAMAHIAEYGSGHTDAIVTEDGAAAERFLTEVDSAIVLHNASTQFADGAEFGFGAEIGIGTGRLHARGPVGAEGLTTYKYIVHGQGQIRP